MTASEQDIIDKIYQSYKADFNKITDDICRISFSIMGDMAKHGIDINIIGTRYLTDQWMVELSNSFVKCENLIQEFIENHSQS